MTHTRPYFPAQQAQTRGSGTRHHSSVAAWLLIRMLFTTWVLMQPAAAADDAVNAAGPYGIGRVADDASIAPLDIDILPNGHGLPAGSGDAIAGETVYMDHCAHCHGIDGSDGVSPPLAGGQLASPAQMAADTTIKRTIGNYWGYATTVFDYVRRAMPYDRPGSLSDDQVYAVTAYLLYLNSLISDREVMSRDTLPEVVMPAQGFYRVAGDPTP